MDPIKSAKTYTFSKKANVLYDLREQRIEKLFNEIKAALDSKAHWARTLSLDSEEYAILDGTLRPRLEDAGWGIAERDEPSRLDLVNVYIG